MKAIRSALWSIVCATVSVSVGLASAQGIFTCVDSHGRKITSDRPIPECNDRVQRELNASGSVKRQIGPTLTAKEQSVQDEKAQATHLEISRQNEERRRDKALLSRYPNATAHDRMRAASLVQIDEIMKSAVKQVTELGLQRQKLDTEMEFYKRDPAKAPVALKRQMEENTGNVALQKRFAADQELEKNRVNARFDDELVKLKPLWSASVSATR